MINPEILRSLDRYLGIPACWLLTLLRHLRTRRPPATTVRDALFVQLAESGSMVLADPAMNTLARRTQARLFCVTFERNASSLAITGTIPREQVYGIRTDHLGHFLADILGLRRWCRRNGIDTLIDLELFTRFSALLGAWTGIPRRTGFHDRHAPGLYRGNLYSHPVAYNPHIHMSRNYLQLVEALLAQDAGTPAPHVDIPDQALVVRQRRIGHGEQARVQSALTHCLPGWNPSRRLILVNPNASNLLPQRRWPEKHYVEFIRHLLVEEDSAHVLLIGAEEDRDTTRFVREAVANPRCGDGAGRFALEDLPALFQLADLLVGNDSGPAHFAAVTTLPVVVLFGPETPTLFRPLGNATVISAGLACSPCVHAANQRRTPCRDNQCMQRIAVTTVLAATRQVLGHSAPVIPLRRLA